MSDNHIILAARITWPGGVVEVTDTTLSLHSGMGNFEPRILGDIRWSEQARHPYQQQGGELVVGDIALANTDGGLDHLATDDVIGAEVELRRGSDASNFASLEFVFRARVSGVRMRGRSELVLELENLLARLAGPVFDEKFDSSVPNPQLVWRDIPLVLGRVKQAPVLEFNPQQLTYYTAVNASKIGQVAEGGNPTQRWTLEEQPMFNLLGSPTLPITADFEGPSELPPVDLLAAIGDFADWPTWPTGWTLRTDGANDAASDGAGLVVSVQHVAVTADVLPPASISNVDPAGVPPFRQWTISSNSASIDLGDGETPSLLKIISASSGPNLNIEARFSTSLIRGNPLIESAELQVWSGSTKLGAIEKAVGLSNLDGRNVSILFRAEEISEAAGDVGESPEYRIILRVQQKQGALSLSSIETAAVDRSPHTVSISPDVAVTLGAPYLLRMHHDDAQLGGPLVVHVGEDSPTAFVRVDFSNPNSVGQLRADAGTYERTVVFRTASPGIKFLAESFTRGDNQRLFQIELIEQQPANTSYKTLAPYILEAAGIDPAIHLDQAAINTHADSFGDPDLGWLIRGDESVDQVLFRLAGSLGGYVWHGLDGKVRSKRLELPTDPGVPIFVIDSSRADIDEITAYDDPAPQLTKRVHALRNWQPIDPDRQAGITSTWTEEDRAAAAADWRIMRGYSADADFNRRWPAVASRDPYPSALLDAADAQNLADQAGLFAHKPRFYELPCELLIGELAQVAVGETVRVELDYPGLNGVYLLVLGREGGARPGTVHLTLWG